MGTKGFWDARGCAYGRDACHYLNFWQDAFASLWRQKILEGLELQEPILDLGAGTGRLAWLWPTGVSLDHSEALLLHHPGRKRVCADAIRAPFPTNSFGSVIAVTVMQFVENTVGVLDEVRRVLRPGGMVVFLDDFSKTERAWHKKSYKNWHPSGWWNEQLRDFRIQKMPVTGLDQKFFAFLGGNHFAFCLSMVFEPLWRRFSTRYECWIGFQVPD